MKIRRLYSLMVLSTLLPLSVFARPAADADGAEHAWASARRALAVEMLDKLDMTSFPNAIADVAGGASRTPKQLGLTVPTSFDDGWAYATDPVTAQSVGVFVLDESPTSRLLCVTEHLTVASHRDLAIGVETHPGRDGLWTGKLVDHAVKGCEGP